MTREEVLMYYNNRCIRCGKTAVTVHEIVPKSKRPKTWDTLDNRVALCNNCHYWAHERGASTSAPELIRLRDIYESSRQNGII